MRRNEEICTCVTLFCSDCMSKAPSCYFRPVGRNPRLPSLFPRRLRSFHRPASVLLLCDPHSESFFAAGGNHLVSPAPCVHSTCRFSRRLVPTSRSLVDRIRQPQRRSLLRRLHLSVAPYFLKDRQRSAILRFSVAPCRIAPRCLALQRRSLSDCAPLIAPQVSTQQNIFTQRGGRFSGCSFPLEASPFLRPHPDCSCMRFRTQGLPQSSPILSSVDRIGSFVRGTLPTAPCPRPRTTYLAFIMLPCLGCSPRAP